MAKVVLTEEQINKIEALAGHLSFEQVADYFEMERIDLRELSKSNPAIMRAYNKGREDTITAVVQALMKQVEKGDAAATKFFRKNQKNFEKYLPLLHIREEVK